MIRKRCRDTPKMRRYKAARSRRVGQEIRIGSERLRILREAKYTQMWWVAPILPDGSLGLMTMRFLEGIRK
jgi:hypothetical protein